MTLLPAKPQTTDKPGGPMRMLAPGSPIQMPRWMYQAWTLLLMMTLLHGIARAQATADSSIVGRVTDTSGALLPGAHATLTALDTGLVLQTTSNKDGVYTFPSLKTGRYRVDVENTGFKKSSTAITLTVEQTAQVDISLQIGSSNESVMIQADAAAQLDTQDSNLAYVVGSKQVADLPLNGRNAYGLAALSPGIAPGASFGAGISTQRGAVVAAASNNFQANGGIGGSNEVLLDGLPISVCCQGQPPLTPSVEIVDQFKVITSAPPAQFGRSSGGILNIVTKSGTNHFHGDVYEFFRNDKLDAANYFTKRSGVYPIPGRDDYRLPHRFNQFGGFVSGPVTLPHVYNGADRTFFTFGYEGGRNAASSYINTTVPTTLMRQGIFTEAPSLIYDPNSAMPDPNNPGQYVRQPLPAACGPQGCYPAGRYIPNIDPVAQKYLALLPLPNAAGSINNYNYAHATTDVEDQYNFRIDHNFSETQRSYVRGTRDVDTHHENDLFNLASGPNSINQALTAYLFAIGHSWTASPNLLVQISYGFGYQKNLQVPGSFGNFAATDYGFSSNFASQQQVPGLPIIAIGGTQEQQIGTSSTENAFVHYTHTLGGAAILQRGAHTLTFGYDGRLILENEEGLSNPLGTFSFDTTFTNGPNPNGAVPSGQTPFDSFAAFLTGDAGSGSLERQATVAFNQFLPCALSAG